MGEGRVRWERVEGDVATDKRHNHLELELWGDKRQMEMVVQWQGIESWGCGESQASTCIITLTNGSSV
eukprot:2976446-Amphidinium_carterae.1